MIWHSRLPATELYNTAGLESETSGIKVVIKITKLNEFAEITENKQI